MGDVYVAVGMPGTGDEAVCRLKWKNDYLCRVMLFKDIIGQKKVKADLLSALKYGRLPHAILLSGKSGHGSLPLALALAQYVFCENPAEGDACGVCHACVKTSKLIHPDLHITVPAFGAEAVSDTFLPQFRKMFVENAYMDMADWIAAHDAESKQWNITAKECLSIVKKLNMQAYEGRWKVQVIWMAEYLAKEGNRLLKIIEEPPADTFFVLIAENEDRVLSTILSRCQVYRVPLLHDADIYDKLLAEGVEEGEASVITRLAGGNYSDAIRLREHTVGSLDEQFISWLRICFKGNAVEMNNWTDGYAALNREEQKKFVRYGLNFMHELVLLKVVGKALRLSDDKAETALKIKNLLDLEQINEICRLLDECGFGLERNANIRLLMFDAAIQLKNIYKKTGVVKQPLHK